MISEIFGSCNINEYNKFTFILYIVYLHIILYTTIKTYYFFENLLSTSSTFSAYLHHAWFIYIHPVYHF